MKYLVTFANGDQYEVESDLSIAEFAKGYSLTTDIHPISTVPVEPEVAVEDKPVRKTRAKTSAE